MRHDTPPPAARPLAFRHIEAIRAVLVTGSVTAAAERLHVTQPAVSNTLRDAELRLGFKLFERRAGHLLPPPATSRLPEEIERAFTGLDDVNALADRIRKGEGRRLVVASTPAFAATALPGVLSAWHHQTPDALIAIESRNANQVATMVAAHRADIGFGPEVPALKGLASEVIAQLPMVCYLPATHNLARRGGPVRAHELLDDPMISPGNVERIEQRIAVAFSHCERMPRTVVECPVVLTACTMVAAGMGFTLSTPLPLRLLAPGRLSAHRFEPQVLVPYRAYWMERHIDAHDRERLLQLARAELEVTVRSVPGAD
jgi:DNA-binding transcriptional LysR family regulator